MSSKEYTQTVPCPSCRAPIFVRENGSIVAHYNGDGLRCNANEMLMPCDCWKHKNQVCDICQSASRVSVAAAESQPAAPESNPELKPCPFCGSPARMEVLGGAKSTHRTICCTKCKCDLHWQITEALAIAAWNTRTPSPADEVIRELSDALQKVAVPLQIQFDLHQRMCEVEGLDVTNSNAYKVAKERLNIANSALARAEQYRKSQEQR